MLILGTGNHYLMLRKADACSLLYGSAKLLVSLFFLFSYNFWVAKESSGNFELEVALQSHRGPAEVFSMLTGLMLFSSWFEAILYCK